MKNILKNINHYLLLSQAGLREDMAKRIMYSVIEPITKYPDSTALSLAIEGWKDIVKYGTKAVVGELRHSRRNRDYSIFNKAFDLYKQGKYLEALDLAIEDYAKPWQQAYGGPAWGRIASQVKEILLQGQKLEKDPSIQNQKDMVIQLNVFDGLAHNTESVMRNLSDIESKTLYDYDGSHKGHEDEDEDIYNLSSFQLDKSRANYNRIRELMDAKELKNFLDVWREIKPEIEGMGSIFFKPYKGRLHDEEISEYKRLTPEQRIKKENNLKIEKALIRSRKKIIAEVKEFEEKYDDIDPSVSELKKSIEKLKPFIAKLENSKEIKESEESEEFKELNINPVIKNKVSEALKDTDNKFNIFLHKISSIKDKIFEIKSVLLFFSDYIPDELKNFGEVPTIIKNIQSKSHEIAAIGYEINKMYSKYMRLFDPDYLLYHNAFPSTTKINECIEKIDDMLLKLKNTRQEVHNLTHI